jgi:hypothetical protein
MSGMTISGMARRRRITGWDLATLVAAGLGVLALSLTSMSIDQKFHDASNPVAVHTEGLPLATFDGWHWAQLWVPALVIVGAVLLLLAFRVAPHLLSRIPVQIDVLVPVIIAVATFLELNRGLTYPKAVADLTKRTVGPGTWLVVVSGVATMLLAIQSYRAQHRALPVTAASSPAVVDVTDRPAVTETREFEPVVDVVSAPVSANPEFVSDRAPALQGEVIDVRHTDVRSRWRSQRA